MRTRRTTELRSPRVTPHEEGGGGVLIFWHALIVKTIDRTFSKGQRVEVFAKPARRLHIRADVVRGLRFNAN